MTKSTATQLAILADACARADGLAVRPAALRPAGAAKIAARLLEQGLVRELRAKGDMPAWRADEHGRAFSLRILKAGRAAVQAMAGEAIPAQSATDQAPADQPTTPAAAPWAAADVEPTSATDDGSAGGGTIVAPEIQVEPAQVTDAGADAGAAAGACTRPGSKRAIVLALLSREGGATAEALMAATGWLPHTTRAALSGLRKGGLVITRGRDGEGEASVYRLAATSGPANQVAADDVSATTVAAA